MTWGQTQPTMNLLSVHVWLCVSLFLPIHMNRGQTFLAHLSAGSHTCPPSLGSAQCLPVTDTQCQFADLQRLRSGISESARWYNPPRPLLSICGTTHQGPCCPSVAQPTRAPAVHLWHNPQGPLLSICGHACMPLPVPSINIRNQHLIKKKRIMSDEHRK